MRKAKGNASTRLDALEQQQAAQEVTEGVHPSWPIHKLEAQRIMAALPAEERGAVEEAGEQALKALLRAYWQAEHDKAQDFPMAALRAFWWAFGGGPYLYGNAQEHFAWSLLFKLPVKTGMGRHVRSFGDGPGLERLYQGYWKVQDDFPFREASEALAIAAYRAAFGEQETPA